MVWDWLTSLLYPQRCLGCDAWGAYICANCVNQIHALRTTRCAVCRKPSSFGMTHHACRSRHDMSGITAAFPHVGVVRSLLGAYKYRFVEQASQDLIELVVSLGDLRPIMHRSWLVVPIPLHVSRLRWRGFNQAATLAQDLADYAGWEYASVLERNKKTKSQARLTAVQRQQNVQQAFRTIPDLTHLVQQRDILLVDDIYTTGATMRAAAKPLLQAGASQVWGFTVAMRV